MCSVLLDPYTGSMRVIQSTFLAYGKKTIFLLCDMLTRLLTDFAGELKDSATRYPCQRKEGTDRPPQMVESARSDRYPHGTAGSFVVDCTVRTAWLEDWVWRGVQVPAGSSPGVQILPGCPTRLF